LQTKLRVLIVEDDPTSANALRTLISARGFEVIQAVTLADAIGQLDHSFFAVLLDLMLPDGDGAAVLKRMREINQSTKVIVMTGVNDAARIDALKTWSPEGVLKKPLNLADLFRHLSV